uniref:NADH dehydrogenase subunit 6 n=1 Tax=Anaka burmensis TaxID=2026963 RepID=UPI00255209D5|nr:NADH dehydrogenase subunit 6 [Anaka burmensis]UNZ99520.1 NADH dehydrogenase subunit 6 [Anaka burmensis]
MKFFLLKILMIVYSMVFLFNTPMSLGLILLFQTMIVIIYMNKIMYTSWFTMITFLMMIGGLLILFSYMSSIASNEMFKIKINLLLLFIFMMIYIDEMFINNQINENQNLIFININDLSMTKIYNLKSMMLSMFLVLYLLLTMISVSMIVKHYAGPLRNYNYE